MADANPMDAGGGGLLAGFAAFVRSLRSGRSLKEMAGDTLTGVVTGLVVYAGARWYWPDEPSLPILGCCVAAGFISIEIVAYTLRVVEHFGGRLVSSAQQRIDHALPPAANGNDPPAAPPAVPGGPVAHD